MDSSAGGEAYRAAFGERVSPRPGLDECRGGQLFFARPRRVVTAGLVMEVDGEGNWKSRSKGPDEFTIGSMNCWITRFEATRDRKGQLCFTSWESGYIIATMMCLYDYKGMCRTKHSTGERGKLSWALPTPASDGHKEIKTTSAWYLGSSIHLLLCILLCFIISILYILRIVVTFRLYCLPQEEDGQGFMPVRRPRPLFTAYFLRSYFPLVQVMFLFPPPT